VEAPNGTEPATRRVGRAGATALLVLCALGLAVIGAGALLRDWRVRVRTLVKVDPPPGPVEVRLAGHRLSVTGAVLTHALPDRLALRAWTPGPTVRVTEAAGPDSVLITIANVPPRARLESSGPVEEERAGTTRRLRVAPRATRRIAFVGPDDDLGFFVLGDTGDNPGFGSALLLGAIKRADFLLHTGDVVYDDAQLPNIRRILDASPLPVYFARGNHDYRNAERLRFMRELGPPYYVFRVGAATFVVLDNAGDYLPMLWRHSTQYRWWTGTRAEPRPGPLFVAMHKPPFDRRTGPQRAAMLDRRFAGQLMRDFRQAGVDAVFTGHVHDAHLWVEDGIPYVVSGEGFESPHPSGENRVAWIRIRGGQVAVEYIPIWRGGGR
jgi:3',5'-cyclic AMP phosphodiesterase CpdA